MGKEKNVIDKESNTATMGTNSVLTHGLLLEDFKQNLLNLISGYELDIQSKALVLDYVNIQIQNISAQQTQKEFQIYKQSQIDSSKDSEKETS